MKPMKEQVSPLQRHSRRRENMTHWLGKGYLFLGKTLLPYRVRFSTEEKKRGTKNTGDSCQVNECVLLVSWRSLRLVQDCYNDSEQCEPIVVLRRTPRRRSPRVTCNSSEQ